MVARFDFGNYIIEAAMLYWFIDRARIYTGGDCCYLIALGSFIAPIVNFYIAIVCVES